MDHVRHSGSRELSVSPSNHTEATASAWGPGLALNPCTPETLQTQQRGSVIIFLDMNTLYGSTATVPQKVRLDPPGA